MRAFSLALQSIKSAPMWQAMFINSSPPIAGSKWRARRALASTLCGLLLSHTALVTAQPSHAPHHQDEPSATSPEPATRSHHGANMPSAFGSYAMTREGSGTAWQPEATPMQGRHAMRGDWMLMFDGRLDIVHDHQSGPRGDSKNFTASMLMGMGQRPLAGGTVSLRGMVSLDPAMGAGGYPLLFQSGETADGSTHLVDRQHPHDALMELAASYSRPVGDGGAVFIYGGLPGEPALGPSAFMHRPSGQRNPEAPLTHHWLDSTHITFGVVTLGASRGPWKFEGSWFNAREPDQHRWNIETRSFDSWSTRISFNPAPDWALQISRGDLQSPEGLEPDTRVLRTTASASHHLRLGTARLQTTAAWGLNDKRGPHNARLPGWLLESSLSFEEKHTVFGRFERVKNNELFDVASPLHDQAFRIDKLSLGYVFDFAQTAMLRWSAGAVAGAMSAPSALDAAYGRRPISVMLFLQARL